MNKIAAIERTGGLCFWGCYAGEPNEQEAPLYFAGPPKKSSYEIAPNLIF